MLGLARRCTVSGSSRGLSLEGGTPAPHLAGGPSAVDAFLEAAVDQMAAAMGDDETLKTIEHAKKSPEWEGEGGWKHRTKDEG